MHELFNINGFKFRFEVFLPSKPCSFSIRAVARTLMGGGGGGCIFVYSSYARLTSFEINFISKDTSRAEPEYMNIHPPPPINVLATALFSINNDLRNEFTSMMAIL